MAVRADSILNLLRQDRDLRDARRFVVAFSGGLDSTVLLDLLRRALAQRHGTSLLAAHVDHNLQPSSAAWAVHCKTIAERFGVAYETTSLQVTAADGESPEAAARAARYAALSRLLETGDVLVTAHHRDDQCETVLLQLLRGAGPAGLAGMPRLARFDCGWLWRPLLAYPRSELLSYAGKHDLVWQEDPSNAEHRFDRNYLRHSVMPSIAGRWPGAAAAIARAAAHSAEAAALLREIGAADSERVAGERETLSVSALSSLSAARQRNALRAWIGANNLPIPNAVHIDATMELLRTGGDVWCVSWPGAELRRYRDRLFLMRPLPPPPRHFSATLSPDGPVMLPDGLGQLRLTCNDDTVLALPKSADSLVVRFRGGGETIRPRGVKRRRKLRNLYQEAGVVPWMRDRIPLVFAGRQLVAVGDLWIGEESAARAGIAGLELSWDNRPRLY